MFTSFPATEKAHVITRNYGPILNLFRIQTNRI
jgi:hypothetical protein